jgi:hypothetical protein
MFRCLFNVAIASAVCGYTAYSASTSDNDCTFKDDAMFTKKNFCYIMLFTAVVNVVFAVYFQTQVWKQIKEIIKQDAGNVLEVEGESTFSKATKQGGGLLGKGLAAAGTAAGRPQAAQEEAPQNADVEEASGEKLKIQAPTVQEGFKETFKKDFGVLIFFLASLVIVFLCYSAKGYVAAAADTGCDDKEMEGWAYYTGFGFFFVPFIYTSLWYCCSCCAKSAQITLADVNALWPGEDIDWREVKKQPEE